MLFTAGCRYTIRVLGKSLFLSLGAMALQFQAHAETTVETPYLQLEENFDLGEFGVGLDVAVSPQGDVYLSSYSRGGLWRLDPGTQKLLALGGDTTQAGDSSYRRSFAAIETDSQNRLWAANPLTHTVEIRSGENTILSVYASPQLPFDAPVALSRLPGDGMAVWDKGTSMLWLFTSEKNSSRRFTLSTYCVAGQLEKVYCLNESTKELVAYNNNQIVAQYSLVDQSYTRIGDVLPGPGGDLYLTDTAGGRFLALSSDLQPRHRFYLQESLFVRPTRFAFHGDALWLIDEGRKELLHFTLRKASTGLDHALLGEEYLAFGYYEPALQEFDKAVQLGYENPEMAFFQGVALYGLGNYSEALAAFRRAQRFGKDSALWQGNTLFRLGQYENALSMYRAARGSSEYTALFNEGQTLLLLKQYQQAAAIFRQLIDLSPDDPNLRLGLARALLDSGDYQRAITLLAGLSHDEAIGRQARFYLGLAYLKSKAPEKALPLLQQAVAEGPYFKQSFGALAIAYRELGNLERAEEMEKRAKTFEKETERLDAYLLEDGL